MVCRVHEAHGDGHKKEHQVLEQEVCGQFHVFELEDAKTEQGEKQDDPDDVSGDGQAREGCEPCAALVDGPEKRQLSKGFQRLCHKRNLLFSVGRGQARMSA